MIKPPHIRIREIREDHNMTQKQVAEFLGIRQQYYSEYEKGVYELPVRHLTELVKLYNCSADYILGLSDYKHSLDTLKKPFYQQVMISTLLSDFSSLLTENRHLLLNYLDFLLTSQNKSPFSRSKKATVLPRNAKKRNEREIP
ncbi:helix-turn-helix domain-containing protein [Candidatus Soleaferrea massiliensis]|uniref:helix-turn-helix domain-containing protein n=1 Tax=Candidatus Soleaferrea massiliensis TaxID=1470354 RepID=UPI0009E61CAC|nr:helix-turn-helix transcriptional regulator [Candidatus Soleaferrea massiliensis]